MGTDKLERPPIVEALVEIRWELKEKTQGGECDPYYKFLLGKFRDAINGDYPFHEALPTSHIPDDISGYTVKHRFRVAEDEWPLVQIGPGIITVNETKKYETFDHFRPRVLKVVHALYESYPDVNDLNISRLQLRYIDAHDFDYSKENVCDFISEKMHIESTVPAVLLLDKKIQPNPVGYGLRTSFRCDEPPGVAEFLLNTGHRLKKRAIIWNQILTSSGPDVPDMPDGFDDWIDAARGVIRAWFEGIISGELREEYLK